MTNPDCMVASVDAYDGTYNKSLQVLTMRILTIPQCMAIPSVIPRPERDKETNGAEQDLSLVKGRLLCLCGAVIAVKFQPGQQWRPH
jgi:hypothetical protein